MKLEIDLTALQDEEGGYSEQDAKDLERLTGKPFTQIVSEAKEAEESKQKPDKPVSKWSLKEKNDFIRDNGRQAYQEALRAK